jgi:hypothetical protein
VGEGALEAVQRIEGEAAEMADERRRTESVVDGLRTMVEAAAAAAMHAEALAADALAHAKAEREELVAGLTSDLDVMHSKLSHTQVTRSLRVPASHMCSTPGSLRGAFWGSSRVSSWIWFLRVACPY